MRFFRVLMWVGGFCLAGAAALWWVGLPYFNGCQTQGTLVLKGPAQEITIKRDAKGMAYIYAGNLEDSFFALGFITAQDRLFQMHLMRLVAQGRISEVAGEKARGLDILTRTVGINRMARRHAGLLRGKTKRILARYAAGVNAYIRTMAPEMPLEFSLAGLKAEPWTSADSLSIYHYQGFLTSANVKTEIIMQMLVDRLGPQRAAGLFPLNKNPDFEEKGLGTAPPITMDISRLGLTFGPLLTGLMQGGPLALGSNNWVAGPGLSPAKKPIVANDPHMSGLTLPGVLYSAGLITPLFRVVGFTVPGMPGFPVLRNQHIAVGITNAYGDMQDLFVETLVPKDPSRYLEGDKSLPFEVIKETLNIKDASAPGGVREEKIAIRLTSRGPVVSGVLPGLKTNRVLTLRHAPAHSMDGRIGFMDLLFARSAQEASQAVAEIKSLCLNVVFGDQAGNIGWRVSGRIPLRRSHNGSIPWAVKDSSPVWRGWIPPERMPQAMNPAKGWLGTCNHKTISPSYPYYYSSYFASSYRYRRLKELFAQKGPKDADWHWRAQRDAKNTLAASLAPLLAGRLLAHPETRELGEILSVWDHVDDKDHPGPTIFQSTYLHLARLVLEDELGSELTSAMLKVWYFWQERVGALVASRRSPWFDDVTTRDKVETLDDLVVAAGLKARKELQARLGGDPVSWRWGKIHTLELLNPLRREGLGKGLVGTGPMPMGGSGETLYRGWYDPGAPYAITTVAVGRMVADLADGDKVLAVLPGGISGRTFTAHAKDQVKDFMKGTKRYLWFSDEAIDRNTQSVLKMTPVGERRRNSP